MDVLSSILVNLISNVAWLPITLLFTYIVFWWQVRLPNRRLWRLKNPSRLVVCASTSTVTNTGIYHRPATGVGQLRALTLATRSLFKAYRQQIDIQNILLSTEPLQERIEDDILILGGPEHNEVSRKYLELLLDEQPLRVVKNLMIWRTNHLGGKWVDQSAVEYEGHVINRKVTVDYGVIMHTSNPFTSRNSTIVHFFGSHTYGTVAAAKFFTEDLRKHLRKLTREGRKNYVVLVSAQIVNGYPTKIQLEREYSW